MRLVELLLDLTAKWQRWEEEFARIHGLTQGMVWVILRLDSQESVCSKELAERIDLSMSRASRLVDQMVGRGLLFRDCDPDDRRRCTLCLSETGAGIRAQLMRDMDRLQEQLQEEGQFCDWSKMIKLLEKLKMQLLAVPKS